jgi:hypothetical protein
MRSQAQDLVRSALILIATPHVFAPRGFAQILLIRMVDTRQAHNSSRVACQQTIEQLADLFKPTAPFRLEKLEPDTIEVPQDQVCKALAGEESSSCARTRPAIAESDRTGENRCGSGSLSRLFWPGVCISDGWPNFSGKSDEPIKGIDSLTLCYAHDAGCASQVDKQSCETTFTDFLFSARDANQNCRSSAAFYRAAVARIGKKPYME